MTDTSSLPSNLPALLILAAGQSTRMRGEDKLVRHVNGMPLVRHVAETALGTSLDVFCVVSESFPDRRKALAGLDLQVITSSPGPMSLSMRTGLEAIPHGDAIVLLADMPEITTEDITAIATAGIADPEKIYRGTSANGQPGHPVFLPSRIRAEIMKTKALKEFEYT